MSKRTHKLDELTKACDGLYDGDRMRIVDCSCKRKKFKPVTPIRADKMVDDIDFDWR